MASAAIRTVFVAGASGAIGRVLCGLLIEDGWRVIGSTRSTAAASELRQALPLRQRLQPLGDAFIPVVLDVFDRAALISAVTAAHPDVVIHQLTDLPKTLTRSSLAAALPANARIREEGTANLVEAALRAGARRIVAQSIAFAYAPGAGPRPLTEDAPLDLVNMRAVASLEQQVLGCGPRLEGVVLRYGRLYGPRTWFPDGPPSGYEAPVHVDAAADAARRALTLGRAGAVYNIAEEGDGAVSCRSAREELGWDAGFRAPQEGPW